MGRVLRADLHVHTWHSGYNNDLPYLRSRDCFSDPLAVYRAAKARGMDLVAITDHDSLEGGLELLSRLPDHSDVILGEEISCWLPDAALEVHFGAYGMTEALHRAIQPLRGNAFEVAACLREAGVFFAFNHPFHFYRGQIPLSRLVELVELAPAVETRNGAMLPQHNLLVESLAASRGLAQIGGSDAHTLRRVGRTWTAAPGATREEFLRNLAAGRGRVEGSHGGTLALSGDIYGVIARYWLGLLGLQRLELGRGRRAFGLAFSVASLPFEFIPFVLAARSKRHEARWVGRSAAALGAELAAVAAAEADGIVAGPEEVRALEPGS